jgi:iron complex outermembrane recepter protein
MALGVGSADADPSPRTLRMRGQGGRGRVVHERRVAQPTPDVPADQPATPERAPETPAPVPQATDQDNVTETPNLSDEDLAKMAEQEAEGEEVITVTGSLVGRKELTTSAPMSVVDREKLVTAGVSNVGAVLQKLPSQGNAINAQVNNGGDGSTRIDLRSLGTSRTLVLINGRRVVPGGLGANSSVDMSAIPLAMIERVEVLKDGASAIYGSDAIGGVVNVITRSDFDGTEATAYSATSQKGDGTDYDLSLVTGKTSPKGNVTFALGFQHQDPVMSGDRGWATNVRAYDYENKSTVLSGSSSVPTGRLNSQNGGTPIMVPGCMSRYCTADGNGGWRDFEAPTETSFGDNYNFQPVNYLFTPSQRVNLFSTGHHEVAPTVSAFFEASYNKRTSEQQLAPIPLVTAQAGTPISADSMYNPFGVDVVDYNRRLTEFGPRSFTQNIDTARAVIGIGGKVEEGRLEGWKWELSFNYGRTTGTEQGRGNLILSRVQNALGPSFDDPSEGPTCGTPDEPIPECVPLNILTPGNITPKMVNYLTFTGISSGFNEQRTTLAQASGKLMDIGEHGDISVAFGGDYRHEAGADTPDPLTSTGDTTGNASQPTAGSFNLVEGFGELSIVPIAEHEVAKWVEINLAARGYVYDTFGSGVTYKAGGLFRTVHGIAARSSFSTSFRAPSIGQLYQGTSDSFPSVEDPCDTTPPSSDVPIVLEPNVAEQCAKQGVAPDASFGTGQQRASIGGNPNLEPETAKTLTAGVVFEPLKGLGITLDYWNFDIDNSIDALSPSIILSNCYEHGQQKFCDQVIRDPVTHAISYIVAPIDNVGGLATSGLDFSVAYSYEVAAGKFRHSLEGTYLFAYDVDTGQIGEDGKPQILKGKGYYDLGVLPTVKFNLFTSWQHKSGVGAGFSTRYIHGFKECEDDNCNDPEAPRRNVPRYFTADLFADYAIKSKSGTTRIAAGINNIANVDPPVIYAGTPNSDAGAYDFMGRYFYLRLSQLF